MIPSGGKFFLNKLRHLFLFPLHILKLRPYLKKTDIIHFRAPTGFGVLFLPPGFIFFGVKKYGLNTEVLGTQMMFHLPINFRGGFYYIFQKMQLLL